MIRIGAALARHAPAKKGDGVLSLSRFGWVECHLMHELGYLYSIHVPDDRGHRIREELARKASRHAGLRLFLHNLALLLRILNMSQLYFARMRSKSVYTGSTDVRKSRTYRKRGVYTITSVDGCPGC